MQELPTLGGASGSAWALNDAGVVVGNSYASASVYRATVWADGTANDLGTLGGQYSIAYDINSTGWIVGSAYDTTGRERATLWTAGNPVQNLGGLPGSTWSTARGVNDVGQVVLWTDTFGGVSRAALWHNQEVRDLGTLGGDDSWAYGLNNHGHVVGWAELQSGNYHAFVHDGDGMADLGTLGGMFSSAYGINDDGIIVGSAQNSLGQWEAVRWVPVPEPSALCSLALGVCGLAAAIRRRRVMF